MNRTGNKTKQDHAKVTTGEERTTRHALARWQDAEGNMRLALCPVPFQHVNCRVAPMGMSANHHRPRCGPASRYRTSDCKCVLLVAGSFLQLDIADGRDLELGEHPASDLLGDLGALEGRDERQPEINGDTGAGSRHDLSTETQRRERRAPPTRRPCSTRQLRCLSGRRQRGASQRSSGTPPLYARQEAHAPARGSCSTYTHRRSRIPTCRTTAGAAQIAPIQRPAFCCCFSLSVSGALSCRWVAPGMPPGRTIRSKVCDASSISTSATIFVLFAAVIWRGRYR